MGFHSELFQFMYPFISSPNFFSFIPCIILLLVVSLSQFVLKVSNSLTFRIFVFLRQITSLAHVLLILNSILYDFSGGVSRWYTELSDGQSALLDLKRHRGDSQRSFSVFGTLPIQGHPGLQKKYFNKTLIGNKFHISTK